MLKRPRVIPCLLIENNRLVKTKKFKNPDYLGDPVNAVKIFNEKQVDELCILDISHNRKQREPDFELLEEMASEAFMPLSYGGGISNFQQVQQIFRIGYEKIVLNSLIYSDAPTVKNITDFYGSQSVIASIDIKKRMMGKYICYIDSGAISTRMNPKQMVKYVEKLGVGEIFVNNIDRDGLMNGYDINLIKTISNSTTLPVISCGGAGSVDDLYKALKEGGSNAVSAGSIFVYYGREKGVLINFPSKDIFIRKGIYTYE